MTSNKEMIADYFDSISGNSEIPVSEYFADDIEWFLPPAHPFGGPFSGVSAVLNMMADAGGLLKMETIAISLHSLIADGENVVAHFRLSAKTTGGMDYANEYMFRFLCAGQKIVKVWECFDTYHMYRMGMFELSQDA